MKTKKRILLCAILACLLVAANGCYKAKARLTAGAAGASLNAPAQMATALGIMNDGKADAHDVVVTEISLAGATLVSPATMPIAAGDIPKDGSAVVSAAFSGSFQPGNSYTIHVSGTFREHGHHFPYAFDRAVHLPPAAPGGGQTASGTSPAQVTHGAPYPYQPPNFPPEANEGGHGWTVPNGPAHPPSQPKSTSSGVQPAPKGDPPQVDFETNQGLGLGGGNSINEPSGAVSTGGIVFETANSYAAWSQDGVHFTQLQPTTIFPNNADGGFCCDQIVQYVPSIDRFIWVMQYWQGSNGENRYRIAAASPASVQSSNGTAWTYWDITSAQVGAGTAWVDYPDLSVGNNYVYLSADVVINGGGRYVVRIPLSEIQSGSTINFRYTHYTDGGPAYGGHLAQNAQDEIFWAGQPNNSTIRVFAWPESSTNYSWTDVSVDSWPNPAGTSTSCSSSTPDGQDWLNKLMTSFPGTAVLGATRLIGAETQRQNELLFAWSACAGSGFPEPQVQWVALDVNHNFNKLSQQEIWNPNYAFAYPAFLVNANNDIGMSLEWGGGGNYENHVAGFWGDYVVYATTSSSVGTGRFGDYVTIRPYAPDTKRFAAFGYGLEKTTGSDTRYVVFSRPSQ